MFKNTSFPRSLLRSAASVAVLAVTALTAFQGSASATSLATPTLTNQASQGWWVGNPIFDSGNLSGAVNPTGFITFKLFGPSDPTCGQAPIFTSRTAVSANAYYASASFTTDTAGTYHWISSYSGDDENNATVPSACGLASATTMVAKRNVTLSGDASDPSGTGVVTNTATLGTGVGPTGPTGTITWSLFGPNNMICSGAPVFTAVSAVRGNGTYTSAPFTLTAPGKYGWKLSYTGDANNNPQSTTCSDPANQVTFAGASNPISPITLTAGPTAVNPGDALTVTWSGVPSPTSWDWIGLYPVGSYNPIAWRYTGGTAGGTTMMTVPATAAPGNYEARLRTTRSGPVTVS